MVVCTYVRGLIDTQKKAQRTKGDKLVYDCLGGAIEQLIHIRTCPPAVARQFINELLKYIEKVVTVVLKQYGPPPGEICANLMIKREDPLRLDLEYFGTFLHGRSKLTLGLEDPSLPGAPEAYLHKKVMYIDNTMSDTYKRFFDINKPYRSILSIPIPLPDGSIFAVLNIDSHFADQFMSEDFIGKKILPVVSPFIALLKLEQDRLLLP